MEAKTADQLWGGETTKAVENFQISGQPIPAPVIHWLGPDQGGRGQDQRRARRARRGPRRADRQGRRRGRERRARRPVPDRRLPDRLRHLLEHERERGDRRARRRRGPSQRPRQHGPVLERRLPLRRPPGGARARSTPTCCPALDELRAALERKADEFADLVKAGPHPPDGRGAGHPRTGVRRATPRRSGSGPSACAPRWAASGRSRSAAPRPAPASTPIPSSPPRSARSSAPTPASTSPSPPTPSRRRATATRSSSCRARSRRSPSRCSRSPTTWR